MSKMDKHEDDWEQIFEDWKASGLGLKKWCIINNRKFYKVRYRFRKLSVPNDHRASFVEVKEMPSSIKTVKISIGRCQILVEDGFDPILLKQTIEALGGN